MAVNGRQTLNTGPGPTCRFRPFPSPFATLRAGILLWTAYLVGVLGYVLIVTEGQLDAPYRQLTAIWRLQGWWAALIGRKQVWGEMTRSGFGGETDAPAPVAASGSDRQADGRD